MKLDYFSFTIDRGRYELISAGDLPIIAHTVLQEQGLLDWWLFLKSGGHFGSGLNRAPYSLAVRRSDDGVRIYGHPQRAEILIEMAGRACDPLNEFDHASDFVRPLAARCTRLDLALDFETDLSPEAFVSEGYSSRFRTRSSFNTSTGQTEYVGSMKSDRMARVYRYFPPHPRSHLLRIEHVFRRDAAKAAAHALAHAMTADDLLAQVIATFGWQHSLMSDLPEAGQPITAGQNNHSTAGRIWWLYEQVAPAVAEAMLDGELDWDDWVSVIEARAARKRQHRQNGHK